ncbi:MAG: PAS domain S-box protein [Promethearchaeota archaeon]
MISNKNNQITNFKNIFPYLMETIDDLIIIVSMHNSYEIEYVHKSKYSKQLGYSDGTLQGKSLFDLVNFGEITPETDILGILDNNRNDLEVKVINKDGNLTWALLKSSIIIDEREQQKILIVLRDISRIKDLEIKLEESEKMVERISKNVPENRYGDKFTPEKYHNALKESEVLLKTAIESLPFDVFMIEKNGLYAMQNSVCKKHWGDVIGKRPNEVTNNQKTLEIWENNNSRAFSGELVTGEESFNINGNIHHFYNIINPVYINNEIQYIFGINIDITEKKDAERKLQESEEKFRTIAEQSLMGICIIQDFIIKYSNQQMAEIYGYSSEEIKLWKPRELLKVIHPDSRDMVEKQLIRKQQGSEEIATHYIMKIIRKNGNIRYIENYSKPIRYHGKIADLIIQVDITARVNAERKINSSEAKYQNMLENMMDGYYETDLGGRLLYANAAFCKIIGYSKEEIIGKDNRLFYDEHSRKILFDTFSQIYKTGIPRPPSGLVKLVTLKKKLIYFEGTADLQYDSEGKKIGFFGIVRDITQRKIAEQKLRESEIKYRHLYENSPNSILLFNLKGEMLDCNLITENLLGFKREELIGKNYMKANLIPQNYFLTLLEEFKSLVKKKTMDTTEIQFYTREGISVWVNIHASLFDYQNEKIVQVIIQPIDDIKRAEEKFRNITEQSLMGIFVLQDGIFKYFNEKLIEIFGYTVEEMKKWSPYEFMKLVHHKDKEFVREQARKKQAGDTDAIDQYNFRLIRKDGEIRWIEIFSKTIDYEGNPADLAMIYDITDQKNMEKKLKESEEKYHYLFETSPDGVILTNLEGTIIECNSAIERITGYSPKDLIGKKFMNFDQYLEDGLEKLLKGYKNLLKGNKLQPVEFPFRSKDNQIKWVGIRSTLVNMKGQSYILAVILDITMQKEAEESIRKSEKKFRDLLETSSVGVIEFNVLKNEIKYMNPKLVEIIGYNENEFIEEGFFNKLIHPKDFRKILETREKSELEFRIFDKFGKLKWLAGKTIPNYDETGQINSIRVWLEDITEKKMYENLIYELNINFLNFTADIKNNIRLLLETCLKLLNGDFILYIKKTENERQESYQILTSNNRAFNCNSEFFASNLFVSALFYESHDFPQTFFDIDRMSFVNTDPFIAKYNLKGCFGKLIKSEKDLDSAVCVFYRKNPVISNQDKLVMFLICDAIEIEQRRWQVQRGLEEQNITLNKINNLKTELFSRTSHELKTPLISIKGFTELLLTLHKPKLDNDVLSILGEIKDGSKRLEKIINLLLESTKLEAGQLDLNLNNEDLSFLINFCVKELKGLAKLRDQSITLKLHEKLETQFDKERIYEVFSNLLVNAIKYTPPGGNITIESKKEKDCYLISVKDTGIGFTTEEKAQAFKQFGKIERYGQGWDVSIEGTGLGLYITNKLVELHGGKIWLESAGRNKGSTFYFTIPHKKNDE